MLKSKRETRRGFLRGLGFASAKWSQESKQPTTGGESADDAFDVPRNHRELSKKQFGLRTLFYVTLIAAVLLAVFRDDIVRRPFWLLGAFVIGTLLVLVQEGCVRLFDAFLWKVFGDGDRKGR